MRCLLMLTALLASSPADASPRMSVAIVMQGEEAWIGNDQSIIDGDDAPPQPGALVPLKQALSRAPLAASAPDARAVLVTYGKTADIRAPLGPITSLAPEAFGTQSWYSGARQANLGDGVALGLAELRASSPDRRRMLIVIGDGADSTRSRTESQRQLAVLRHLAAADQIEVRAIVYKTARSDPETDVTVLDENAVTTMRAEDIVAHVHRLLVSPAPASASSPASAPSPEPSGQTPPRGTGDASPILFGVAIGGLGAFLLAKLLLRRYRR